MPPRTPRQALAAALAESVKPTVNYQGLCLRAVRTFLGVRAAYPSAIRAWEAVPDGERNRSMPPPGVPVFWDLGKYGHVALAVGHGVCWSTDIRRAGRIDAVALAVIERRWNGKYLGWTRTLNGVHLPE